MRFYTWLMKNRWRADPIGDLARDIHKDPTWPKRANTWIDVRAALSAKAEIVQDAGLEAWTEYELYVGGASHIKKGTWVYGVIGSMGLELPREQ